MKVCHFIDYPARRFSCFLQWISQIFSGIKPQIRPGLFAFQILFITILPQSQITFINIRSNKVRQPTAVSEHDSFLLHFAGKFHLSLFRSYQQSVHIRGPILHFVTMLQQQPLSAVHACLFNILQLPYISAGGLIHPQPANAPWRSDKEPLNTFRPSGNHTHRSFP